MSRADETYLGAYQVQSSTGTMAAGLAGASPIFSFRWSSIAGFAAITKIQMAMESLGTGFAAGVGLFDLIVARAFTAADTGGAALSFLANDNAMKTGMGTGNSNVTLVSDFRTATTGTLSAGTRTLDSNPMSALMFGVTTATNTVMLATSDLLVQSPRDREWPLALAASEGFVIRATVPATGTWKATVTVSWKEVTIP